MDVRQQRVEVCAAYSAVVVGWAQAFFLHHSFRDSLVAVPRDVADPTGAAVAGPSIVGRGAQFKQWLPGLF